jgi:hypothetical protein
VTYFTVGRHAHGMSDCGPKRRFTAMQRYVRSWSTNLHGADIVSVPRQPRHAALNCGEPRSNSGSFAMFAAMRRASSRVNSSRSPRASRVSDRLRAILIGIELTGRRLPRLLAADAVGYSRIMREDEPGRSSCSTNTVDR